MLSYSGKQQESGVVKYLQINLLVHRIFSSRRRVLLVEVIVNERNVVKTWSGRWCWWLCRRGRCAGFRLVVHFCIYAVVTAWHLVGIWCIFNLRISCIVHFGGRRPPIYIDHKMDYFFDRSGRQTDRRIYAAVRKLFTLKYMYSTKRYNHAYSFYVNTC